MNWVSVSTCYPGWNQVFTLQLPSLPAPQLPFCPTRLLPSHNLQPRLLWRWWSQEDLLYPTKHSVLTVSPLKYMYNVFKQPSPASTCSPLSFQAIRAWLPPDPAPALLVHRRQENHCLGQNKIARWWMRNFKGLIHLHLMNMCSTHSGTTFRNTLHIVLMSVIALGVLHHRPDPFGIIQIHSVSLCTTNADSKSMFPYLKEEFQWIQRIT